MKSRMVLFGALFIAMMTAGTSLAEDLNPVVGKVGDFVLREADLDRFVAGLPAEAQAQLQKDPSQRSLLAKQILQTEAIAQRARKERYDRKPEVRERLEYLIDDFLAREYLTKVVLTGITVSDKELRSYYDENKREFIQPEEARVRHIFFPVDAKADAAAKAAVKAKAEGVLARVKKGEDFAALAAEYSEDADTAKTGGELGIIRPGQTNAEAFEKGIFALKAGEAGVVESPFGYHVVRVDERHEQKQLSFDQVKDALRKKLLQEAEQKKLQEFVAETAKQEGLVLNAPPTEPAKPEK